MKLFTITNVLAVALVALAGWTVYSKVAGDSCCPPSQLTQAKGAATDPRKGAGIGRPAPAFELTNGNGERVSLEDLRGKPAVVVFWSAYCSSCKKEAPKLNQLAAEYSAKGVRVIGVSIDTSDAHMNEGVKDFGIEYEYARDPDTVVAKAFKVVGTPTVILLDPNGVIGYSGNTPRGLPVAPGRDDCRTLNAIIREARDEGLPEYRSSETYGRGAYIIIPIPISAMSAPIISNRSGVTLSMPHPQKSAISIKIPLYAACTRPKLAGCNVGRTP